MIRRRLCVILKRTSNVATGRTSLDECNRDIATVDLTFSLRNRGTGLLCGSAKLDSDIFRPLAIFPICP